MKKLLIAMCVALLSMSAQAQEKGNFAVGLRGGATISKIKIEGLSINETSTRFGIGVFGIQPSEFAKIGIIIFTSKYLAYNEKIIKDTKNGVLPILVILMMKD